MRYKIFFTLMLVGWAIWPVAKNAFSGEFRFLATGDLPYSATQESQYRKLLAQAATEKEPFEFLMHVGDIKSGDSPCTDEVSLNIRDIFASYPTPVVYTIGDNEWTDCQGAGVDPVERLTQLRKIFFRDEAVLRLGQLGAEHQSRDPEFTTYVENYRFMKSNVLFVVVHVCGSGNNRRPDHPPAMQEFEARNKANLKFLEESFSQALTQDVAGVAVVIHANPGFERPRPDGFGDFISAVRGFLDRYEKPVICIHGDSHYFRIDKPLRKVDGSARYFHFTRVEVFGSPDVAGLVINVNPASQEVFHYAPYYLRGDQE